MGWTISEVDWAEGRGRWPLFPTNGRFWIGKTARFMPDRPLSYQICIIPGTSFKKSGVNMMFNPVDGHRGCVDYNDCAWQAHGHNSLRRKGTEKSTFGRIKSSDFSSTWAHGWSSKMFRAAVPMVLPLHSTLGLSNSGRSKTARKTFLFR